MEINDRTVEVSHTDKVFFQRIDLSKGDLIAYYRRIADVMIPHMVDRPLTLQRFPDGIGGEGFYQQEASEHFPEWIERIVVKKKEGGQIAHVACSDEASLVYLVNQGCVSFHAWLSKRCHLEKPDRIVFDLDPPSEDTAPVLEAAKRLKGRLEARGLVPFVMSTGSRGLHVVVPIVPERSFEEVRGFAHCVAIDLAEEYPEAFTTEVRKKERSGRVFIDYLRNAYGQTTVVPYSVRAIEGAPVATPLDWSELSGQHFDPRAYTVKNMFRRLGQKQDPWASIDDHAIAWSEIGEEDST